MGIEEIVDVQISIQDGVVERESFGVGLIIGQSNRLTGSKVQEFASPEAVAAVYQDGDPELTMANDYFGQTTRPTKVLMGDQLADVAQEMKITIPSLQDSTLYSVSISIDGGVAVQHDFTSGVGALRSEIVDGLIAAIGASSQAALLNLTDNGDDFDIESAVAGDPLTITLSVNLAQQTVTANRNIVTELAAMQAVNNNWYALMTSDQTVKNILRTAEFIQARKKIYGANSADSDIVDSEKHVLTLDFDADFVTSNLVDLTIDGIPVTQTPFDTDQATTLANLAANIQAHANVETATVTGARQITITSQLFDTLLVITALAVTGGASQAVGSTSTTVDPTTDIGSQLKALGYDRTFLFYTTNAATEYPAAAWIGYELALDPGTSQWFGDQLAGITVDNLSDAQKAKALGNDVNTYTVIGGINVTQNGKMVGGRFIDVRRDIDKWVNDQEVEVYRRLVIENEKVPFTDEGIAIIQDGLEFANQQAVTAGILTNDPAPVVTVPRANEVSANDRAARCLTGITNVAQLAGGIIKVVVRGTVSA